MLGQLVRLINALLQLYASATTEIANLKAALAEALSRPPVGQDQIDAAKAEADAAKAQAAELQGKLDVLTSEDQTEEQTIVSLVDAVKSVTGELPVE